MINAKNIVTFLMKSNPILYMGYSSINIIQTTFPKLEKTTSLAVWIWWYLNKPSGMSASEFCTKATSHELLYNSSEDYISACENKLLSTYYYLQLLSQNYQHVKVINWKVELFLQYLEGLLVEKLSCNLHRL